jgi:hypothetical protein
MHKLFSVFVLALLWAPITGYSQSSNEEIARAFVQECEQSAFNSMRKQNVDADAATRFAKQYCACAKTKYMKDLKYFNKVYTDKGQSALMQDKKMKRLVNDCVEQVTGGKKGKKQKK